MKNVYILKLVKIVGWYIQMNKFKVGDRVLHVSLHETGIIAELRGDYAYIDRPDAMHGWPLYWLVPIPEGATPDQIKAMEHILISNHHTLQS